MVILSTLVCSLEANHTLYIPSFMLNTRLLASSTTRDAVSEPAPLYRINISNFVHPVSVQSVRCLAILLWPLKTRALTDGSSQVSRQPHITRLSCNAAFQSCRENKRQLETRSERETWAGFCNIKADLCVFSHLMLQCWLFLLNMTKVSNHLNIWKNNRSTWTAIKSRFPKHLLWHSFAAGSRARPEPSFPKPSYWKRVAR